MTTVNIAQGATKALAAALVSVRSNDTVNPFAMRKLKLAVAVATNNAGGEMPNATISMPADFADAPAAVQAISEMTGCTVKTDGKPLPKKVVEQAEANEANFDSAGAAKSAIKRMQDRNAAAPGSARMQPRYGKTARSGGKAASEARKRERSARDREIRSRMKNKSGKAE